MNKNNYRNILMALLFMLIALPTATMAQTNSERYMVVTENDGTVTVFDFDEIESVTWGVPQPLPGTFGTAKATINGTKTDVEWIQLWEDGPKFAKYNVGVTDGKAESYGGYYCFGASIDKDPNAKYPTILVTLTGILDTATKLWGKTWRMPTRAEFDALLKNCDVIWTDNYKDTGVKGRIFTGKGDYLSNSMFLPATGYCIRGQVSYQGDSYYWSSSVNGSSNAYLLNFSAGGQEWKSGPRDRGCSVRAVLAE